MKKLVYGLYGLGALMALHPTAYVFGQSTTTVAAATPEKDKDAKDKLESVIVTGTRQLGLKAVDSAAPIQVLDASTLQRVGQPDLIQAISQNIPSFQAQAFGGDTANLTLSARLRGLSPNNTLVLINGKRRHGTSNLAVLGGPFQGGAAADLNFIPLSAISRIEVLQDGAAAQYGSDAIAGVVNIILKSADEGGSIGVMGGGYYDEGGHTGNASANFGLKPMDNSFVNVTAETRYHGHSDRGGIDPRVVDATNLADPLNAQMSKGDGYPYLNHISGDAAYRLNMMSLNAGIDLSDDLHLYSFGTYGRKSAEAFENYRLPSRLTYTPPGSETTQQLYPFGFNPKEGIEEDDGAITVGIKGKMFSEWNWDFSSTYGRDNSEISTLHSGNRSLYADTGYTPTDFYDGKFLATQWTNNLDFSREFEVGLVSPLNVAFGLEQRTDQYSIGAGDAASRYKEGGQSYPGFQLTDAGKHTRKNYAAYVDVAGSPLKGLELDIAARFEHFNDFGNATVGKLTGRYDFNPVVAIRGTVSNGFRAPTLAEQYYSATNVGPGTAFVQLPPSSAGAKLVGIDGLKPEKSQNYSFGVVLNPAPQMNITVDAYAINIHNRIVGSGTVYGTGGSQNSAAVNDAIAANGNVLDAVEQTGINIFTNGVDTRNRGVDIVFTYASDYAQYGRVDWSASGNYNKVTVSKINQAPAQLAPQSLLDATAISDIETASPKYRVNLAALWRLGNWTVNLRETMYGPSSEQQSPDGGTYYNTTVKRKLLTDLEVSNQLTKALSITVGANNLFNQYPTKVNQALLTAYRADNNNSAVTIYPSFSPFGINGGFYYAKANYTF